jgi:sialate O-acetylesterase
MKTHVISRMRNINCNRLLSVFMVLLSLSALPARAVIRLAAPFGEHMVLQQGVPISIWGTGCPGGDEITVSVAGQSVTAKSDWAGRWMVQLAPMMAGGPYQLLVEVGRFKRLLPLHPTFWSGLALEDVLIGEVVLAPAQSGKTLAATKEGASEIASAKYPWIHMYTPPAQMVGDAPTEAAGKWTVTSPDTAGNFSATAYFLARELYNKLHVPIGVVRCTFVLYPIIALLTRIACGRSHRFLRRPGKLACATHSIRWHSHFVRPVRGNPSMKSKLQVRLGLERTLELSRQPSCQPDQQDSLCNRARCLSRCRRVYRRQK